MTWPSRIRGRGLPRSRWRTRLERAHSHAFSRWSAEHRQNERGRIGGAFGEGRALQYDAERDQHDEVEGRRLPGQAFARDPDEHDQSDVVRRRFRGLNEKAVQRLGQAFLRLLDDSRVLQSNLCATPGPLGGGARRLHAISVSERPNSGIGDARPRHMAFDQDLGRVVEAGPRLEHGWGACLLHAVLDRARADHRHRGRRVLLRAEAARGEIVTQLRGLLGRRRRRGRAGVARECERAGRGR